MRRDCLAVRLLYVSGVLFNLSYYFQNSSKLFLQFRLITLEKSRNIHLHSTLLIASARVVD